MWKVRGISIRIKVFHLNFLVVCVMMHFQFYTTCTAIFTKIWTFTDLKQQYTPASRFRSEASGNVVLFVLTEHVVFHVGSGVGAVQATLTKGFPFSDMYDIQRVFCFCLWRQNAIFCFTMMSLIVVKQTSDWQNRPQVVLRCITIKKIMIYLGIQKDMVENVFSCVFHLPRMSQWWMTSIVQSSLSWGRKRFGF